MSFFYRIRVHYTVLTQHTTPTNNTQPNTAQVTRPQPARSCLHQRGDLLEQQPCCPRHPTACHNNKTNHQNQNTNTSALQNPLQPIRPKDRKSLCFINSYNPTHKARVGLVSPENKNRHHQAPHQHRAMTKKLATNQVLTSTHR